MALLPILRFPDPRLQKIARPVDKIDDSIRQLATDMAETMYEAPGIGLAATQVDVHLRVVVIDVSEERKRAAARQALRERKIEENYQDWLRQLRDRAYVEIRIDEK